MSTACPKCVCTRVSVRVSLYACTCARIFFMGMVDEGCTYVHIKIQRLICMCVWMAGMCAGDCVDIYILICISILSRLFDQLNFEQNRCSKLQTSDLRKYI